MPRRLDDDLKGDDKKLCAESLASDRLVEGELGQEYRRYLVGRSPAYLPWCIRSSQVVGRDGEVPHDAASSTRT